MQKSDNSSVPFNWKTVQIKCNNLSEKLAALYFLSNKSGCSIYPNTITRTLDGNTDYFIVGISISDNEVQGWKEFRPSLFSRIYNFHELYQIEKDLENYNQPVDIYDGSTVVAKVCQKDKKVHVYKNPLSFEVIEKIQQALK